MNRKISTTGFTLLELILVMLILTTVLGLAGPSLKGFFSMRQIEATAAQIVALTKFAQSQAVCEGRIYRLNLDVIHRTYWLTIQDQGAFIDPQTEWGRVFQLPEDVGLEVQDLKTKGLIYTVDFSPMNRTTPGLIRLTTLKGDRYNIMCRSATENFALIDDSEVEYEDNNRS